MAIQTATGWDDAGSLSDVSIQPRVTIPEPGRVRMGGDMLAQRDGAYHQKWMYGYLTKANFAAILSELGVSTAESAKMTVRTLGRDGNEANWNAIIVRPPAPDYYQKFAPVEFDVYLIEAL